MSRPLGLYLHIPYCSGKCHYCGFYSQPVSSKAALTTYKAALLSAIRRLAGLTADTLFMGGGTPSVLGDNGIAQLLSAARDAFSMPADAEITVEVNPEATVIDAAAGFFAEPVRAGLNRVSIGMQSAHDGELKAAGRRHSMADVRRTVAAARAAGIKNLSLDLIAGLPGQTAQSLLDSVDAAADLSPEHLSLYLLSVEPGTVFAQRRDALSLPDSDALAELYLLAAERLDKHGFTQYEISNFARPGCECRHNLKYWTLADYVGLGPAAHSLLNGRRFYYPDSVDAFLAGAPPVDEPEGSLVPAGSWQERLLLHTRLCRGFDTEAEARSQAVKAAGFDTKAEVLSQTAKATFDAEAFWAAAAPLITGGLARREEGRLCLTRAGMLVQNSVVGQLIDAGLSGE